MPSDIHEPLSQKRNQTCLSNILFSSLLKSAISFTSSALYLPFPFFESLNQLLDS